MVDQLKVRNPLLALSGHTSGKQLKGELTREKGKKQREVSFKFPQQATSLPQKGARGKHLVEGALTES